MNLIELIISTRNVERRAAAGAQVYFSSKKAQLGSFDLIMDECEKWQVKVQSGLKDWKPIVDCGYYWLEHKIDIPGMPSGDLPGCVRLIKKCFTASMASLRFPVGVRDADCWCVAQLDLTTNCQVRFKNSHLLKGFTHYNKMHITWDNNTTKKPTTNSLHICWILSSFYAELSCVLFHVLGEQQKHEISKLSVFTFSAMLKVVCLKFPIQLPTVTHTVTISPFMSFESNTLCSPHGGVLAFAQCHDHWAWSHSEPNGK